MAPPRRPPVPAHGVPRSFPTHTRSTGGPVAGSGGAGAWQVTGAAAPQGSAPASGSNRPATGGTWSTALDLAVRAQRPASNEGTPRARGTGAPGHPSPKPIGPPAQAPLALGVQRLAAQAPAPAPALALGARQPAHQPPLVLSGTNQPGQAQLNLTRTAAERHANPERLNLDRRGLKAFPLLQDEER